MTTTNIQGFLFSVGVSEADPNPIIYERILIYTAGLNSVAILCDLLGSSMDLGDARENIDEARAECAGAG